MDINQRGRNDFSIEQVQVPSNYYLESMLVKRTSCDTNMAVLAKLDFSPDITRDNYNIKSYHNFWDCALFF